MTAFAFQFTSVTITSQGLVSWPHLQCFNSVKAIYCIVCLRTPFRKREKKKKKKKKILRQTVYVIQYKTYVIITHVIKLFKLTALMPKTDQAQIVSTTVYLTANTLIKHGIS